REGTYDLVQGYLKEPREDDSDKAHRRWKRLNGRAVATIKVNCGTELQNRLRDVKKARDIWLYIERHYGKSTTAKGIEAYMKLSRIQYDDHNNMRSYFAAAYTYMTEINRRSGHFPIHKWEVCLFLVKGLPAKFDIWTSNFMQRIE